MILIRLISLVFLCSLIEACSPLSSTETSMAHYVQEQKNAARTLRQEGRLADSLAVWRTVLPLGPADAETANAIATLEADISKRVNINLRKAERSYSRGNNRNGDAYMLKVLALSPGQSQALERLERSYSARALAEQKDKNAQEYRVVVQREQTAPDSINRRLRTLLNHKDYSGMLALGDTKDFEAEPDVAELLRSAYIGLADQAEQAGELDAALAHMQSAMALQPRENDPVMRRSVALRQDLSLHWYQHGSRLIKNDLPQAIAALQKSLVYNPYNDDARRKLLQAETLQRNLKKIEGTR